MWFDKTHPDVVYVDTRAEVEPTIVADTRQLPPEVGDDYDMVVFDPPHTNVGANSHLAKKYGHHTSAEIRELVRRTAGEAYRVTRPNALMIFKWNDHSMRYVTILECLCRYWEPLFGQQTALRTKHASSTRWTVLRRRAVVNEPLVMSACR